MRYLRAADSLAGFGGERTYQVLSLDMEMKDIIGIEESFKQAIALDLADAVGGKAMLLFTRTM